MGKTVVLISKLGWGVCHGMRFLEYTQSLEGTHFAELKRLDGVSLEDDDVHVAESPGASASSVGLSVACCCKRRPSGLAGRFAS